MIKKKLPEITLYCPKCGKTPPKDEKQSNENWTVIPAKCPTCKLRLKIKVD
jgi:NAD-dependent SIR2 family protein deacetylase